MNHHSTWKFSDNDPLFDYTLIVPSVAVGNVGQLACDLVVSSLGMTKIASACSPALIPVLGYDPYDLYSDDQSTSCDVYKCTSRRLAVVQFRAPLVQKYARHFLQDLVRLFKSMRVKDIVILTSSFAHENKHIEKSPFRYVASDLCPYKIQIESMNWVEHDLNDGEVNIFGGGFASLLYNITKENEMPCLILYKYCSEGDNIPDAYDMVTQLANVVTLFPDTTDLPSRIKQPVSWKLLYGGPPPEDIY